MKIKRQEQVIEVLNEKMTPGHSYPYHAIVGWFDDKDTKLGTITSVLTKAKMIGAIEHDNSTSLRKRTRIINVNEIIEYSKSAYVNITNNLGINQRICDKIKALMNVGIDNETICKLFKIKANVLDDVVKCNFKIREFNNLFRERLDIEKEQEPKDRVLPVTQNLNKFLSSLEGLSKAVNETILAFKEYNEER